MIDFGLFHFGCAPFCDARWFSEMMLSIGHYGDGIPRDLETPFLSAADPKLRVSLVKHPKKWLEACFDAITIGAVEDFAPFTELPIHSFDSFVRCYIKECPGSITTLFSKYEADTIMRVEDLPWGLVELLESFEIGEKRAHEITKIPRSSHSPGHKIDSNLHDRLLDADFSYCERYDYV